MGSDYRAIGLQQGNPGTRDACALPEKVEARKPKPEAHIAEARITLVIYGWSTCVVRVKT
jgi:hypothetical protein